MRRETERGERAQRDQRVHVRFEVTGAFGGAAQERPARPELDRTVRAPAVQRAHASSIHPSNNTNTAMPSGHATSTRRSHSRAFVGFRVAGRGLARSDAVADVARRRAQRLEIGGGWVEELTAARFGREVDRGGRDPRLR